MCRIITPGEFGGSEISAFKGRMFHQGR
jgi:hypothetical protein